MEIQNYPNYLIYQDGKVWSKNRQGTNGGFLKPSKNPEGYPCICLHHQGKGKSHKIHRLVASHYIPNPENKSQVDHIDRNRENSDISNLRWVTQSENQQNTIKQYNNKSGHKNICYSDHMKLWVYQKMIRGHRVKRTFKTLPEALCFKYIHLLKIKANHQTDIRA